MPATVRRIEVEVAEEDPASYGSEHRRMMALALGQPYIAFPTLEAAREDAAGVVILEGNDANQIYVVAFARDVRCSVETLAQLLQDLDALAWGGKDPEGAKVVYERHEVGDGLPGGIGGGRVTREVWVHPQFDRYGLADAIRRVVQGQIGSIAHNGLID